MTTKRMLLILPFSLLAIFPAPLPLNLGQTIEIRPTLVRDDASVWKTVSANLPSTGIDSITWRLLEATYPVLPMPASYLLGDSHIVLAYRNPKKGVEPQVEYLVKRVLVALKPEEIKIVLPDGTAARESRLTPNKFTWSYGFGDVSMRLLKDDKGREYAATLRRGPYYLLIFRANSIAGWIPEETTSLQAAKRCVTKNALIFAKKGLNLPNLELTCL